MSMTVGEHDRAWLSVMNYEVPSAVSYLKSIAESLKLSNQLRWLELVRATQGNEEIKEEILTSFGKQLGFIFSGNSNKEES